VKRAYTSTPGLGSASVVLLVAVLFLSGCPGPGFLAYVIHGPPEVKAQYMLAERATLVIVDDPYNALGDPNYPAIVGANVGYHLKENGALEPTQVVSQDRLSSLAAQLGDRYPTTPIDVIGARLKADQVIYIRVRSVKMQIAGAYYHPVAVVEVKVIDALDGVRLYPKAGEYTDPQTTPPGQTLSIELQRQTIDPNRRHAGSMLARSLAERIGLEVAQMFYDHVPPEDSPGS
jgi:hypothetical protein